MTERETRTTESESIDPEELLPEESGLNLGEYLAMQKSIGNEMRFRILYALKERGEMSLDDLRGAFDVEPSALRYHLDELCDVGLVLYRERKTVDSDELFSYYVASAMGEAILEHGVKELMQREWEFKEKYS